MNRWRLERYLMSRFLLGAAPVLLVLLGLFSFLALTEELEDVGRGAFTTADALAVVLMSLPVRTIELAPVSALLGTLIGIGALATHNEIVALRAAGLSPWRLSVPVGIAAVVAALAILALQAFLVPSIERQTALLRAKANEAGAGDHMWIRTERNFVRAAQLVQGRSLADVEIFELDAAQHLLHMRVARSADVLDDGRWLLHEVRDVDLAATPPRELVAARAMWTSSLTPEQTATLTVPVEALALGELRRYIEVLENNGLNAHRYRVQLWQQIGVPVGLLAMAMLGLPFLLGPSRSVPVPQRIALGGGAGIAFYLSEQLSGQAAILYELDPATMALAPDLLLLAVSLALTSQAERHDGARRLARRLRFAVIRAYAYNRALWRR